MIIMLIEETGFPCAVWLGGQAHSLTWVYEHSRRHESVWMVPGLWRGFQ